MWIVLDNLVATVSKATADELRWLDEYLSFPDQASHFKRWHPNRVNKIQMLDSTTRSFPTGFALQVVKAAKDDSIDVRLIDRRRPPQAPDPTALIDWLRPYQSAAIAVAKTAERGIFHHPTGAGKTEVMIALAEVYDQVSWLILTHNKSLIHNTTQRFMMRTGEVVGVIGEGMFAPRRVTVATFQSVYAALRTKSEKLLSYLPLVRGVMVDEAHVVPAKTYWRVLMALDSAYYRYGFTGTPFARSDKKSIYLWGAVGPVIHRIKAQELIDAGVLAKPEIRMMPVRHKDHQVRAWAEAYNKMIVNNDERNNVVLSATVKAKKPCFLFVNHVQHGKSLVAGLQSRGVQAEFVWGTLRTAERTAAIERLVNGAVDVIVCNVVFQEGIDVPELQSVVIAQGGKSIIAALQRTGRGMRRKDKAGNVTKDTFRVYDVKDVGCGCASTRKHKNCRWMERHTRHRLAAYASESYSIVEESTLAT